MSRKTLSSLLPLPPRLEIPADGALPMEVLPGGAGETHDLDESIQHVHSPGMADSSLDTSMMSVSDLNSIGFDSSSVDWASVGQTPRGPPPPGGGKAGGAGGAEDPLQQLLPPGIGRACELLVQVTGAGGTAHQREELQGKGASEVVAALRRLMVLALKRDALSRASAMRLFTATIRPLVQKGEASQALSELKQHLGHAEGLMQLRLSFLSALPSISLPPLTQVSEVLHSDGELGLATLCDCVLSRLSTIARQGWTPSVVEHVNVIMQIYSARASHSSREKAHVRGGAARGGGCLAGVLGVVARARGGALAGELRSRRRGGKAIEGMWGSADVDQMLRGETMPPSNVAVAGVAEFDAGEGARGVAEGWLHGGGGIASYYVSALKSEVMADLRRPIDIAPVGESLPRGAVSQGGGALSSPQWTFGEVRSEAVLEAEWQLAGLAAALDEAMSKDQLAGPAAGQYKHGAYVGVSAEAGMRLLEFSRSVCESKGTWVAGHVAQRASLFTGCLLNWMQRQTHSYPRSRGLQSMVFLCGDSFRLASDIEKARSALQRASGGTPEEHAGLLDIEKVERAGRRLNEAMCAFVVEKIGEATEPLLSQKKSEKWATSGGGSDAPDMYMQNLISDVLSPAVECVCVGPEDSQEVLLPRITSRILESLLEHLMKTRAKVSINGAQRLKGDVDYFKNWIQTSPMVPIARKAGMLSGPVYVRLENVLSLLLAPRLGPDDVSASPLPDAQEWVARRVRKKRALFC